MTVANHRPEGYGYQERIPLALVLDASASMGRPAEAPRIRQLATALERLAKGLRAAPALASRVDIAVVTFSSTVQVLDGGFHPVEAFRPPTPTAGGHSAMLPALRRALDLGREHRSTLVGQGIACRAPVVCLLTDGAPTDEDGALLSSRDCAPTAELLRAAEREGCRFIAVGVGGADTELLASLAPRAHFAIGDFDIRHVVDIFSVSIETAATDDAAEYYGNLEKRERIRKLEQRMQ